jgi:PTH1 family peptidyl-tRNA hydrolase
MNRSGQAVGALMRFRKLEIADVIVVVDDADLELGRLRIRPQGSSGGHNGLLSIEQHAGKGFPRVRIGIGRSEYGPLVDHVLTPWASGQRDIFEKVVGVAADAIGVLVEKGTDAAMNAFNGVNLEEDERN